MICYYAIPKRFVAARRYVLMAFSFIFYACGEFVYFFAILACVFVTWAVSSGIAKKSKLHFAIAMAVNLVPLLIFKYLNFIITNINLIPGLNIPMVDLVMPIGISFYMILWRLCTGSTTEVREQASGRNRRILNCLVR